MAPSWLPSQATVAWWSGFTWCPALSWVFSLYDSHLSIIGHSSSASKLSWLYLHNFPTSALWTQKLFLVLGPSLSFDFLSSRKFFLKLIFFSWFPLPFSFFFFSHCPFLRLSFGWDHTAPSQQRPRTNVLSLPGNSKHLVYTDLLLPKNQLYRAEHTYILREWWPLINEVRKLSVLKWWLCSCSTFA